MTIASCVVYSVQHQERCPDQTSQPTKFMKNTTLQITLAALAASGIAIIAATNIAVAVSYLTVGILLALAVVDYRQGPKDYASR